MAELASVNRAANELLAKESRLDVLMANAGIMAVPPCLSVDGYELQFATNHMGHALLIRKLLPLLEKTATLPGCEARIITLSSGALILAPKRDGIVFDDLKTTQNYWILGPWQRYAQSKLANVLYGAELARRYPHILSIVVNPGFVPTGLVNRLVWHHKLIVYLGNIGKLLRLDQGPMNQLWAVGVSKDKVVPGKMYDPVGALSDDLIPHMGDKVLAGKLWDFTETAINRYL